MSPRQPARGAVVAAFAAVYFIWGSTYLAIRYAVETIPPFLMAGARFALAGAALYVVARAVSRERPTRVHWRSAAVVGGLLLVGGNGVLSWAQQVVPSGVAALLVATVPLFMVLHGWAWGGTGAPSALAAVGLAGGFLGVAILLSPQLALASASYAVPALVIVAAAAVWAGGSIYSRTAPLPNSALLAVAMEMLAGGVMLLFVGLALGEGTAGLPTPSPRSLGAFAYLVVFGSLIGFTCYIWILKVSAPALVSTYAYVNPVVAVVLGAVLAGEAFTARTALAAAVIVASVALVSVQRSTSATAPAVDDADKEMHARLAEAERRFRAAYQPGGEAEDLDLVVPAGFWTRPDVASGMLEWRERGGAPPAEHLELAWGGGASPSDLIAFHENVERYVSTLDDAAATPWEGS